MDGQQYYDNRERRDEQQPATSAYPPQQQQQQQQSPPHSASPFAFAPPPLSSAAGPTNQQQQQQQRPQPVHHQQSEPLPSVQYQPSYYNGQARPVLPAHSASFPASAPMGAGPGGYRSYSNESPGRASPASISRTTSMHYPAVAPGQQSPSAYASNGYGNGNGNRSTSGVYASHSPSARPAPYPHPSYYGSHPYQQQPQQASAVGAGGPASVDMPRSLSYPNYSQSYASYMPSQGPSPYPSHHHPGLPPLMRHNTTSTIGEGVGNMDLNRQGYAFANRLPLVDRPFKCDECVQSFNRNHDLKRHKRIHLQVKPFGCDKCGKTFSRKDALRRHWLVKGCRGEDGATAPILPLYPLNSQPPALSPPTPPHASSPGEGSYGASGGMSFSHPAAPPPLGTLPPRQHNESSTTLLVTPSDVPSATPGIVSLDESAPMMHRTSESSNGSYFEAAQAQHAHAHAQQGGVAIMMEKSRSSGSYAPGASPRYAPSAAMQHHPYRRPSPQRTQTDSPTYGKPTFAASFYDGMLAPDAAAVKMEKQLSQMSHTSNEGGPGGPGGPGGEDSQTWQRWHRPSFPFPPPPGTNYNYQQPPSPVDMQQHQQQQQHGYA